jgi:hypothetical protein
MNRNPSKIKAIVFEPIPYKQGVTGSNPVSPTKAKTRISTGFGFFYLNKTDRKILKKLAKKLVI